MQWSAARAPPRCVGWRHAYRSQAPRPRLFVEHAVALVITGRPDDAEPLLREAEGAAEARREGRLVSVGVRLDRPVLARPPPGECARAVELARRGLSLLPDGEVHVRNYAAVRLGDALRSVGDLVAVDEAYTEAAEIGRAAHHTYGRLAGMVMHAEGALRAGPPAGSGRSVPACAAAADREGLRAVARRGDRPHRDGRPPLRT